LFLVSSLTTLRCWHTTHLLNKLLFIGRISIASAAQCAAHTVCQGLQRRLAAAVCWEAQALLFALVAALLKGMRQATKG
jgi:hypothetical protein